MPDFLLEIGTEEIPARMIDGAREELPDRVGDLLQRERLYGESLCPGILYAPSPRDPRRWGFFRRSRTFANRSLGLTQGRIQRWRTHCGCRSLCAQAEYSGRCSGEDYDSEGRIPRSDGREERPARSGNPGRVAAQRDCWNLLGEEHVLARQVGASAFVRPVRWMVSLLDSEVVPLEVCRDSRRHIPAKAIAFSRRERWRSASRRNILRSLRRLGGGRRCRARAAYPQGPRCRDANHPWRALARGHRLFSIPL